MKKEELENKIKNGLGTYDNYTDLGYIYLDEGRFDDLINLYKELKKRDLTCIEKAFLFSSEGLAFDHSNRIDESIIAYHNSLSELMACKDCIDCVKLKAINNYYLFTLSNAQDENKSKKYAEDALKYFSLIIEKYNKAMQLNEAYSYIAEIFLRTERLDKALSSYKKAIKLTSDNEAMVPILVGIAAIYGKMKNYNKSKKFFAEALEKSKGINDIPMSKIYFDMGIAAYENDYFQDAIKYFLDALRLKDYANYLKANKEYEIDIHWYLSTIAYKIQDYALLLVHLNQLLIMMDEEHCYFANTLLLFGHYYLINNEFEKASAYYYRVMSLKSADEEEIEMAKDCFEKCLKRIPLNS